MLVSSEHGAVYIRSKLLNTVYPSKEEEKRLKLEFEEKNRAFRGTKEIIRAGIGEVE